MSHEGMRQLKANLISCNEWNYHGHTRAATGLIGSVVINRAPSALNVSSHISGAVHRMWMSPFVSYDGCLLRASNSPRVPRWNDGLRSSFFERTPEDSCSEHSFGVFLIRSLATSMLRRLQECWYLRSSSYTITSQVWVHSVSWLGLWPYCWPLH